MSINWTELEEVARSWTYEAGDVIRESLKKSIHIETKSNPDDLVTEVDRAIESFFYKKIQQTYPDHQFLGEEGVSEEKPSLDGIAWIIDPIDGTMNFVHQQYNFAISVSVYHDRVGMIGIVYDVMNDEMFRAVRGHGAYMNGKKLDVVVERPLIESLIGINGRWLVKDENPFKESLKALVGDVRGMRSYGSAALEMSYVAANRLDGYLSVSLSPWDYAAAVVILEEVGCKATSFSGERLLVDKPISVIACKKGLHEEIITSYLHK